MTSTSFGTDRLWLRPMILDDAVDIHVARGDAEAMRWWFEGTSPSVEATRGELERYLSGGAWWAFGRHGETTALGFAGFTRPPAAGEACGFGYLLRRDAWGGGLVAEVSRQLLAYAFDDVGIASAELWIHPGNRQSQRVAEKLGARFRGFALTGRVSAVHGVTADEWRGGEGVPSVLGVVPALDVTDLERSVARWCDGLGFHVDFDTGAVAQVAATWTGGPAVRLRVGNRCDGRVLVTVGTEVGHVADCAAAAGWTLVSPPTNQPWGVREAVLRDDDGNTVWLQGLPT